MGTPEKFSRAAAHAGLDRDKAARNRDQVEAKMTPAQVDAAKRLARPATPGRPRLGGGAFHFLYRWQAHMAP